MVSHLSPEQRERLPRLSFLGTPVHPVLTDVPSSMFSLVPLFDAGARASGTDDLSVVAYWNTVVGVAAAVPTAATGVLDYLRVDQHAPGKRTGAIHGTLNGLAMATSVASLLLRRRDPRRPSAAAQLLSLATAGLVGVSAHLGGELVYEHGYRVDAPQTIPQLGESHARPEGLDDV
jgi:uncharacterized membrane protein